MSVNLGDFFADSSIGGWDVVIALVVAIAGWIASGLAKRATLAVLHRLPGLKADVALIIARVVRYSLILLTVGIVLTILGAPLQPVLAAVLLVCAVLYLALRGIAANLGAGVVLQSRKTIAVGDEIELGDIRGVVKELNGRSVVLHCSDGRSVRIPNSTLLESPLVNLTERQLYRSELEVRARTTRPVSELNELVLSALESTDRVRAVPTSQVLVAQLSAETAILHVRFWHDPHHRSEIRSAATIAVHSRLDAAGIPSTVVWPVPPAPLTPGANP
jgi:small conductance mechanosensitive channel